MEPNYWKDNVATSIQQNRQDVFSEINKRFDWNMTLFVSIRALKFFQKHILRENIRICLFSGISINGFDAVKHFFSKKTGKILYVIMY